MNILTKLIMILALVTVSVQGRERKDNRKTKDGASDDKGIDGVYVLCEEVKGFSGETLELKNGKFRYWFYTDYIVVGDKQPQYPLKGAYSVEGNTLVLNNKEIHSPQRTLDIINGVRVLWRDDGLKAWKKDRILHPYGVLIYAGKTNKAGANFRKKPSIKLLHTKEHLNAKKRRYEQRYNDAPEIVQPYFRALTLKNDPKKKKYVAMVKEARKKLNPKLINALVPMLSYEHPYDEVAGRLIRGIFTDCSYHLANDLPPFAKTDAGRIKAYNVLIDAMTQIKDETTLKEVVDKFLDMFEINRMLLQIPEANIKFDIEFKGGGGLWKTGELSFKEGVPSDGWKKELPLIITKCQEWFRKKIDNKFGPKAKKEFKVEKDK